MKNILGLRFKILLGIAVTLLLASSPSLAESIYENFPDTINSQQRYVIYSHGYIVEGDDPRPVSAQYGVYDFPAVKQSLFEGGGFNLIAHHRPAATDIATYVAKLESWVNQLLAAGVPASRITLIGFSRGSQLTALASSRLRDEAIGTILMANCVDGDIKAEPPVILGGRLLSLSEYTDGPGECTAIAARSELLSYDEIITNTGKRHGTFYTPDDAWLDPVRDWIALRNR